MDNQLAVDGTRMGEVKPLRLIMVDDNELKLRGFVELVRQVHGRDWDVQVVSSGTALLQILEQSFPDMPTLVSVDLGLPPDPRSPRYGLELLQRVHEFYPGLKLAVHSSMPVTEWATQLILSIPATFISTAMDTDVHAYASMLPWIARGFLMYSPAVSDVLSRVVLQQPDPLDDMEWRIVAQIAEGQSNLHIGDKLGYAEGTIAEKVKDIASRLNSLGHIVANVDDKRSIPNKYRDELSRFYRDNAIRYKRNRQM
jgi:DNA-binding NarL/FixJ family response regulator